MKTIRQFICFCPNKICLHFIQSFHKLFQTNIFKLFWKNFLQFSINRLPKWNTSPDHIFKKTWLRFMHSTRSSASYNRLCKLIIYSHFIKRMSSLMNRRKQRTSQIIFIIMCSNSHIMIMQSSRKRMFTLCYHSPIKAKSYILSQPPIKFFLLLLIIIEKQKTVLNLFLFFYLF